MTGELFIVQARPETVQSQKTPDAHRSLPAASTRAGCWSRGRSVGEKIGRGPVRVIKTRAAPAAVPATAKCSSPTRPIPTGSRP